MGMSHPVQLLHDGVQALLAAGEHRDDHAVLVERHRHRAADAGRPSCNCTADLMSAVRHGVYTAQLKQ